MNIDLPSYYQHVVIDSMARALLSEVRGQRLTLTEGGLRYDG